MERSSCERGQADRTASSHRHCASSRPAAGKTAYEREFIRAENEDDDGYDPYSDRRPASEPLFERDPWG